MTTQQIENAIDLCKGEPVPKIMQLFSMGMWRADAIKDMAEYFGCSPDRESVALNLSIGIKA
ncbi:MAG: hypothetical protein IKR80_00740 [Spirochaetales bacterium]|nr:hypothetical protein [Spirochaetales bacterium]